MTDTISEHNDQETLASTGVTDTITVLIEEASSALSCGDSNIVLTYREEILRSLKILVDPHQHNNHRTLAIHIASVRNNIGNIRIALHEYETAYSFYLFILRDCISNAKKSVRAYKLEYKYHRF